MSKKIMGVTVGTSLSPSKIEEKIKPIKTVNNVAPDENGNVEFKIPEGADGKTPYIKNGNWWIGDTDTGVKAEGKDGAKGRGISSILKASTNGLVDTYSIIFTNETSDEFTVTNGKDGKDGEKGDKGDKGDRGDTGADGKDYVLTEADMQEIIDSIRVIYPEAHVIYGDVTEDNTIIIHGTLPAGEYTLKYDGEDGISTGITTLEVRAKTYTNALLDAIDSDSTPYNNGKGYKAGYRLNSSGTETASEDTGVTGFIPVKVGDTIYLDNIVMKPNGTNNGSIYIYLYESSFEKNGAYFRADVSASYAIENGGMVLDDNGNVIQMKIDGSLFDNWNSFDNTKTKYLRFSAQEINDNSVVSVNNPIV